MTTEEKPSASPAPNPLHEKEVRARGQRSLFINVLLMFLVSIVVFAVASYFFLVPKIAVQDLRLLQLQQRINILEEDLADLAADADSDTAATPPAPEPAPKPADAQPAGAPGAPGAAAPDTAKGPAVR
jgi:hypothetical protein